MPEFKDGRNAAELLRQHKEIHDGMDVFEEYLDKCRSGEIELELRVMKEKMDSWGEVLWKHLDQEVKTLGAENMRKVRIFLPSFVILASYLHATMLIRWVVLDFRGDAADADVMLLSLSSNLKFHVIYNGLWPDRTSGRGAK